MPVADPDDLIRGLYTRKAQLAQAKTDFGDELGERVMAATMKYQNTMRNAGVSTSYEEAYRIVSDGVRKEIAAQSFPRQPTSKVTVEERGPAIPLPPVPP